MSKPIFLRKLVNLCRQRTGVIAVPPERLPVPQNVEVVFDRLTQPSRSFFHQKFVLKLHLAGSSRGYVEKNLYDFRPGEGFLIFPFQLHRVIAVEPPEQLRLVVNFTLPLEEQKLLEPLRNAVFAIGSGETARLLELVTAAEAGEAEAALSLAALLAKLRNRTPAEPPEERVTPAEKTVFHYLYDHYQEGLTVKEIAAELGYSEAGIRVKFSRETGRPIGAFLLELRLRDAAQQLLNSARPVHEIGVACGFSDAFVFSRAFKKYFGLSPKNFRERAVPHR